MKSKEQPVNGSAVKLREGRCSCEVREVCNRSSEVRELWGVKGVQCDESCAVQ